MSNKNKRGGARPGSGPTVRRIRLDADTAKALRVLWLARRSAGDNPQLTPADVVAHLIRAATTEYDRGRS
jgi:hypothetical protein